MISLKGVTMSTNEVLKPDYQERRRVAVALVLTTLATLADAFAENGTGWPIPASFGFFLILTTAPLTFGKLLDKLSKE